MNINERDLIKLRKEIERIRKHEESRQSGRADEKHEQPAPAAARVEIVAPKPSTPIAGRLRQVLESLLAPPEPSKESLAAIPEHVPDRGRKFDHCRIVRSSPGLGPVHGLLSDSSR
jgi:hypothetical protein